MENLRKVIKGKPASLFWELTRPMNAIKLSDLMDVYVNSCVHGGEFNGRIK